MKLSKMIHFKDFNINLLSIILSCVISTIIIIPINSLGKKIEESKNNSVTNTVSMEDNVPVVEEMKLIINSKYLERELINSKSEEKTTDKLIIEEVEQKKIVLIDENDDFGIKIRNLSPQEEVSIISNSEKYTYKLTTNIITLENNKSQYLNKVSSDGLAILIKIKEIPNGIRIITFNLDK